MKPIPIIDCHTHTNISFDCNATPQAMCTSALRKGIRVYAITDHYEHCSDVTNPEEIGCKKEQYRQDVEAGLSMMRQMKQQFESSEFKILCGIELGEPTQNLTAADWISENPYDMVIGSLHNLHGHRDFYFLDYRSYTQQELDKLTEQYWNELYQMAQWGKFDTMAHLDYPFRYMKEQGRMVNPKQFDDMAAEVLKEVIQKDKAIEWNTSRFEFWGEENPMLHYLKLFRQLGGKYVTVGSDSHTPETIGFHIKDSYQLIHDTGFLGITYFENRKPILLTF